MNHEYVLTVGDWSCDGHSFYHGYLLKSNKSKDELVNAYRESVIASNIVFHNNDDSKYHKFYVDYKTDETIDDEDIMMMENYGVNIKAYLEESSYGGYMFETPEAFANVFMEFIKKQLPDLKYEIIDKTSEELNGVEIFNGWWTEFNVGIGYGIYTGDNHHEDDHGDHEEDEEYEDEDEEND